MPRASDKVATAKLQDACRLAACFAVAAWIAALVREAPADDAWIVLRYARNLLAGHGWCYEPGAAVNASTSALNTLLLAGFGAVTGDLHRAQDLVFVLGLGGGAWCLGSLLADRTAGGVPSWVASLLCLSTPLFWSVYGMESPLLLGTGVGACLAWNRGRHALAGLLVAAATLTRPEGLLLAPVLVVDHRLRTGSWHVPRWIGAALCCGVPLAAWGLFSLWSFGALFPDTLAAKRAQAESGWWDGHLYYKGAKRSLELFDARALGLGYKPFAALLGVAVAVAAWARHRVLAMLAWIALVCGGYSVLGVPYYHWYGVTLHLGLVAAVAAAWQIGWERSRGWLARTALLLATLGLVALWWPRTTARAPSYPHYREVGAWLDQHAPAEARIGAVEIGCVGDAVWPRGIVDACGLVSPDVVPDLAAGRFGAWFERHRPEYLVLHVPPWEGFETLAEASPAFDGYREVFRSSDGRARVVTRRP